MSTGVRSHADPEPSPAEPWVARWARVPPGRVLAAGASLIVLALVVVELFGEPRHPESSMFLVTMAGYLVVIALATRGALHVVAELPGLSAEHRRALAGELSRMPMRWSLISAVSGCAVHVAILIFVGIPRAQQAEMLVSGTGDSLLIIGGWIHAVALGFTYGLVLRQALRLRSLGREAARVDLLDATSTAPFVRVALRNALLFMVLLAVMFGFHIDWEGARSIAVQMVLTFPLWLGFELAIFALPLWGIHERLRDARGAELARVNAALRGDRSALRGSIVAAEAGSLTTVDLLQFRSQVEALSTWPFGSGALLRLALYGVIPIVGWIGGALVERLIDTAIG